MSVSVERRSDSKLKYRNTATSKYFIYHWSHWISQFCSAKS